MIQISALASPEGSRGNARAASVRAHRNTSSTKTSNAICTPRTPKLPLKFSSVTSAQDYNVLVRRSVAAARVGMHRCARTCHIDRVQAHPTEFIAVHCQEPLCVRDGSSGLVHTAHSRENERQQAGWIARTAAGISRVRRGHGSGPLRVETIMPTITTGTNTFCNHRFCRQP